ncbi:uncharacterized protein C8Q71DRAFT_709596 [Rhodofomes roseus]|uniref:Uncharacterized protein n=1 Tax=Rhodofomes roseus TaxID=34475 RepID=A0ABQ8KDQ8_9APHY|nr:uncharacterized protein C8Q71DRAFT_709596 [Rhodofomes roseus]KAH9835781.1 hypothetical protein C8Q71DRAFT_709596 [Rhodofomes roseus]
MRERSPDAGVPIEEPEAPSEPVPPVQESISRSGRIRRAPRALQDFLPSSTGGLPAHLPRAPPPLPLPPIASSSHSEDEPASESLINPAPALIERPPSPTSGSGQQGLHLQTEPNCFGVFRSYPTIPAHEPDDEASLAQLCERSLCISDPSRPPGHTVRGFGRVCAQRVAAAATGGDLTAGADVNRPWFFPFLNPSVFLLMEWAYTGSNMKSKSEIQRLVTNVINNANFDPNDLRDFDINRETTRLDKSDVASLDLQTVDGWYRVSIRVPAPRERTQYTTEADAPHFDINNVYLRRLLDVIKEAASDPDASTYNWVPYELFWERPLSASSSSCPSSSQAKERVRIFTDVMNSQDVNEEYERVLAYAREHCNDPPDVEIGLVPIALYSDSTHLTTFGSASLWPIYAFFGFVSKYDWYEQTHGEPATEETHRFCRREIMNIIWTLLLDPEFRKAYEEGLLWECGDKILRRLFPRFFLYSADYPEKILLACIRYLAECPCPRCYVRKENIHLMGTARDMQQRAKHMRFDTEPIQFDIELTRRWIFQDGVPPNSKRITKVLGARSLLPIRSAFSRFSSSLPKALQFNHYRLFVTDVLHEFELGVWKARLARFNHRFRNVPTYGHDTIRRFSANVSDLKQMAARMYEDILQCIMPVVDAMLPPPHDDIVMDLLFALAEWHAFAKLRLHTDRTLDLFEQSVKTLGKAMRRFESVTCAAYDTKELPREVAARGRRQTAAASKRKGPGARPKRFALNTYKYHAIGHAPAVVRQVGTLDIPSTQRVSAANGEQEHRRIKRFFPRTNKKNFAMQIAKHQRRERLLHQARKKYEKAQAAPFEQTQHKSSSRTQPRTEHAPPSVTSERRGGVLPITAEEPLGPTPPEARYHVANSQRHWEDIPSWLAKHRNDPATRNFIPRLKDHLLARMLGRPFETDEQQFTPADHRRIRIEKDRIRDSINPRTHPNIMLLAHEDDNDGRQEKHPYWYARVLSVFHVHVRLLHVDNTRPDVVRKLDVLWVRWYGLDPDAPGGFKHRRLPRLGFVPYDDRDAFGFIDPAVVLRASHIIPAFSYGKVGDLLPPSRCARRADEKDFDYMYYYVGMFVDRDMVMRYLPGEAPGHTGTMQDDSETARSQQRAEDLGDEDGWQDVLDEGNLEDEEDDYGYRDEEPPPNEEGSEGSGDEDLDEHAVEDGDLGPEDGEDYDDSWEEGFAQF